MLSSTNLVAPVWQRTATNAFDIDEDSTLTLPIDIAELKLLPSGIPLS